MYTYMYTSYINISSLSLSFFQEPIAILMTRPQTEQERRQKLDFQPNLAAPPDSLWGSSGSGTDLGPKLARDAQIVFSDMLLGTLSSKEREHDILIW